MAAPTPRYTTATTRARVLNNLMNANNRGPVVENDSDEDYIEEAAEDDKARPAGAKD